MRSFGVVPMTLTKKVYFILKPPHALQHRGQESCGIAVTNQNGITGYRGMGLVSEVFDDRILDQLGGSIAVGHCRYSTAGGNSVEDIQPLMANYKGGRMAIAHNGNLVNAKASGELWKNQGLSFKPQQIPRSLPI